MIYPPVFQKFLIILSFLISCQEFIIAGGPDTCLVNDECINAIDIPGIISNKPFLCIQGCNEFASPDTIVAGCQMGDFPTVWYKFTVDDSAAVLNIEVHSDVFESPSISLFKGSCNNLEGVSLSNGNLVCIIGANGTAKAVGTYIEDSTTYFLAVSSVLSIGGAFELCISTVSKGSYCVLDRDFEVVSRSNGGSLEGPFDPAEKLRVCMNVNSYTAAGNGCQWFQGIIPTFGNGWDPSSFDLSGQPYNSTVNDNAITVNSNGVYGVTTWKWFNDVGYHHNNPRLVIGDFDNNGRVELCNKAYEVECQQTDTITGGCCGPCWDDAGDLLPGGWFAYGINGSCADTGSIRVDWGDGNTCGCCMGPWKFCFDLVTRDTPDCLGDSTNNDLTLGYYTFADGEIGAWTGGASVCAYDQPIKLSLKALCGRVDYRPDEQIILNSEDMFTYVIDERDVSSWEWNISPYNAMPYSVNQGENGYVIQQQVFNQTSEPIDIRMIFIGREPVGEDLIIKKVNLRINPWTTSTNTVFDYLSMKVFPNPAKNTVSIHWPQDVQDVKYLTIQNYQGEQIREIPILSKESNLYEVDLSGIANGLYIINLVTKEKIYGTKLVKL